MKFKEIKPDMVIHCPKEEDARVLSEYLIKLGVVNANHIMEYYGSDNGVGKVDTVLITRREGNLYAEYSDRRWFEKDEYHMKITEFSDLIEPEPDIEFEVKDCGDTITSTIREHGKITSELSELIEPEPRFRVGDKVKVRSDLKDGEAYGGLTCKRGMQIYAGKIKTIIWVSEAGDKYRLDDNPLDDFWTDEMLEPVDDSPTDLPMTAVEVLEWLEQYGGTQVAEKVFGFDSDGYVVDAGNVLDIYSPQEIVDRITAYEAAKKAPKPVEVERGWHCEIFELCADGYSPKIHDSYDLWECDKDDAMDDAVGRAVKHTEKTGKQTYAQVFATCRVKGE